VLCSCWAAKGGVGTTVVSVSLAVLWAAQSPEGALLIDLAGDAPAALGVPEPDGPGVADWLKAGDDVLPEAVGRLEVEVAPGLGLIPRGSGSLEFGERAEVLAGWLAEDGRPVVADCGVLPGPAAATVLAGSANHSLLVTRACYLALRRVVAIPTQPSGVVLVSEPGRALGRAEVEQVVGAPVRAQISVEPAVARAVDAGVLASRLPRALARALRGAA